MERSSRSLDFDQWRLLAKTDPEAFENRRRELLEAVIARAPERRRQRLRGLQWRADVVRRRSSSPLAACITLSDMMWRSFAGSNGLVERLNGGGDGRLSSGLSVRPSDNVFPLTKKRPPRA
ncbi:MAG: DUF3135 domain-containing protein [Pseudomonadota bacterium]